MLTSQLEDPFDLNLKILGRFKNGHMPGRNLEFLIRPRIAGRTRRTMLDLERTESTKLDCVAFLERFDHGVKEAVDHRFRFDFGDTGPACDAVDDICFVHFGYLAIEDD